MPAVVVDLERGIVQAGGRGAPVRAAPGRALRVGDDGSVAVLRPLSFGERSHAARLATTATDPLGAVAASVRTLATVSADGGYDVMHDVVALVLAGADADPTLPSYADVALLVSRAAGWEPAALRDADATEVDALAACFADSVTDDGWMRLEMAPPTPESVVERLAEALLRRALPGAGEAGAATGPGSAAVGALGGGPEPSAGDATVSRRGSTGAGDATVSRRGSTGTGDANASRRGPTGTGAAEPTGAGRRTRWRAAWGDGVTGAGTSTGAAGHTDGRGGARADTPPADAAASLAPRLTGRAGLVGTERLAAGSSPGSPAARDAAPSGAPWTPVPLSPTSASPGTSGQRPASPLSTAPAVPALPAPPTGLVPPDEGRPRGSDGAAVPVAPGRSTPPTPATTVPPVATPADLLAAAAVDDAALATRLARLLEDECDLRGYRP